MPRRSCACFMAPPPPLPPTAARIAPPDNFTSNFAEVTRNSWKPRRRESDRGPGLAPDTFRDVRRSPSVRGTLTFRTSEICLSEGGEGARRIGHGSQIRGRFDMIGLVSGRTWQGSAGAGDKMNSSFHPGGCEVETSARGGGGGYWVSAGCEAPRAGVHREWCARRDLPWVE